VETGCEGGQGSSPRAVALRKKKKKNYTNYLQVMALQVAYLSLVLKTFITAKHKSFLKEWEARQMYNIKKCI
jgi:hypothetical protein